MTGPGWVTVVPIKPLSLAKSRLRGAVPDRLHDRLVLAMAQDTVAAALACDRISRVIVVTDDPNAGTVLRASGARWVPDVPGAGLNAAFAYGARVGAGYASALGIAALAADLPAVRPADLAAALHAAGRAGRSGEPPAAPPRSTRGYVAPVQPRREPVAGGDRPVRAFVPDAAGLGTVLLTAPFGTDLDPRFGPGSAAAHAASGAVPIAGDWPGLRCDVDTAADLAAAARLGLGGFTAEVVSLARYGVDHDGSQRGPD